MHGDRGKRAAPPCYDLPTVAGRLMKLLLAEDDPISQRVLHAQLSNWGYQVALASDGEQAWEALQVDAAPRLLVLDWVMPGIDGIELCRRLRAQDPRRAAHVLILTAKAGPSDVIEALEAGADDFLTKPFDPSELRARVGVGARIVQLQQDLEARVRQLEEALQRVNRLQGLLPICAYCKKIRDDQNYWHDVEGYIRDHSEARFTHGVCPACYAIVMDKVKARGENAGTPARESDRDE